ncbi:major capsid protein [Caudoviricetes sp.]|nr:major capsid protein [Caudoviricetes sp.]UOF80993.1 major capsid protein [Caudoviricetes sp.]UOF81378.1 major capsid protein [Caudoviricetes sp.]
MPVITVYEDGNRLEDVMRAVVMLSPTDTPFVSGIAKARAGNVEHQWPEDTLAARGDNAQVEGNIFSYGTVTAPSRRSNFTQVFNKTFWVSSTERWVRGAGVDDQYQYQKQKALMEIANDVEHAFIRGSRASGNASTARRMAGALNFVTTNATTVASETKLTESFFNGLGELAYYQGGRPDEVYVGARLKRVISSYTAGITKNIAADDKRLVNSLDVYESDFGLMKIFLSRDQLTNAGATGNSILIIENRKFKMAVGEPIRVLGMDEVAQDSNGSKGVVRGELTLEVLGERHNSAAFNLSGSFN